MLSKVRAVLARWLVRDELKDWERLAHEACAQNEVLLKDLRDAAALVSDLRAENEGWDKVVRQASQNQHAAIRGLEQGAKTIRELTVERDQARVSLQHIAHERMLEAQKARRLTAAREAEESLQSVIDKVEAMEIGVYEYRRSGNLTTSSKPMTAEEEADGWRLLNTQQAVDELRRRQKMVMGVWN